MDLVGARVAAAAANKGGPEEMEVEMEGVAGN